MKFLQKRIKISNITLPSIKDIFIGLSAFLGIFVFGDSLWHLFEGTTMPGWTLIIICITLFWLMYDYVKGEEEKRKYRIGDFGIIHKKKSEKSLKK